MAPLYPSLRCHQGKHIRSSNKDVESLRRSSTLTLQDSGDFQTEEEIFIEWDEEENIANKIKSETSTIKTKKVKDLIQSSSKNHPGETLPTGG